MSSVQSLNQSNQPKVQSSPPQEAKNSRSHHLDLSEFPILKGLARRITNLIQGLTFHNDSLYNSPTRDQQSESPKETSKTPHLSKMFKCSHMPSIEFSDFVERFKRCGEIRDEVFTLSFILIKRVMKQVEVDSALYVHKLFAVVLFISHKYLVDTEAWFLETFSELAGIKKKRLEKMELHLMKEVLGFKVYTSSEEFERAEKCLLAYAMLK